MTTFPILYSFRRCPYAMRARMALVTCGISCVLREVVLRDKPPQMLDVSPKGTVPILVLDDGTVIDESLDIIKYAMAQNDPQGWGNVTPDQQEKIDALIKRNDTEFAPLLTKYKYFERYPEHSQQDYLTQLETDFISGFEKMLSQHRYFITDHPTIADIALFPLIRQFSLVDQDWFNAAPYPKLQAWLNGFLASDVFDCVMKKYDQWKEGDRPVIFPN